MDERWDNCLVSKLAATRSAEATWLITKNARAWAMDPAVARALASYKDQRKAGATDRVFLDEYDRPLADESSHRHFALTFWRQE